MIEKQKGQGEYLQLYNKQQIRYFVQTGNTTADGAKPLSTNTYTSISKSPHKFQMAAKGLSLEWLEAKVLRPLGQAAVSKHKALRALVERIQKEKSQPTIRTIFYLLDITLMPC